MSKKFNLVKGETVHKLPFDVVSFDNVLKFGESTPVPGLWLQSHYAMDGVQFLLRLIITPIQAALTHLY